MSRFLTFCNMGIKFMCEVDILRVSVLGREYDALRSAEQFIAARKVMTERWAGGTGWAW